MVKKNSVIKEVRQAKFVEALVDNGGRIGEAYKAISGQIQTDSAQVGGSKLLSEIKNDDTKAILEKVGCTKEAIVQGIWERMEKTKQIGHYVRGADVICKIGGFYTPATNKLQELMSEGLDLVEIIKIRLKSKPKNELSKTPIIDVSSIISNSDEKLNSEEGHV